MCFFPTEFQGMTQSSSRGGVQLTSIRRYTHSSASFRNPFQFGVCVTNDLAIASFSCMDRYNNNDNNNKETLKTNYTHISDWFIFD